jgi:hypothetical protein
MMLVMKNQYGKGCIRQGMGGQWTNIACIER